METEEIIYIVFGIVVIGALLLGRSKAEYAKGAKMAAMWMVILATVFAGVVYWEDVRNSRFYTSLVPGNAVIHEDGSIEFSRSADGHFHITAEIDGVPVRFMVDTGASDISLSREDAKKLGIDFASLKFNRIYQTANGMTRGATIRLKNIRVASYNTGEIGASVNEGDLGTSLLGLTFLNRMKSYRVEGDRLILNP